MNIRKFTLRELSQAIGRLQSLHTMPIHCEVCDRSNRPELVVVTSTFVPVFVCLLCGTSLIAHSAKENAKQHRAPIAVNVIGNGNGKRRKAAK